ncbi:Reverse gyrase 1 [uncultured archaeon]|nr:Reverse gyrase 1 [uncultured archaeon]
MKLVICEKPNAAEKVAAAIGNGKAVRKNAGGVGYWETERDGEKIVVVSAVGHLYTLKQVGKGWHYPVFDVEWAPSFEVEDKAGYQKPYVDAIKKLASSADEYVCACDFDTEGSLIGYNILRFACGSERGSRMKFSTLTREDLESAWLERGGLDLENALAGEARHILDWYYGINLSRALMASLRSAGGRQVMSIGRVQGPALAILAKKEKEILAFVSQPYWELSCMGKGVKFEHQHGRFMKKAEADAALASSGTPGTVQKMERKEYPQPPAPPFDLTSLQVEAHRALNIDPKVTLELAQNLYEAALISYPRTSSQKLPAKLNLKKIIDGLSRQAEYAPHARKLLAANRVVPLEGKKDDPAHPAIHPTGQAGNVGERERKLYDLIVRRFLSCFSEPATRESQKVQLLSGKENYSASGNRTVKQGWFEIYAPYVKLEEVTLPEFSEGEHVPLAAFKIDEKKTQPPKRYTAASIISELEKKGLGTKATRATIIDTLFRRGYVDGKSISATPFGMAVYDLLSKSAPEILDDELTYRIEEEMEKIRDGENEKKAIDDGKNVLSHILSKFEGHEREIGLGLLSGLRSKDASDASIGACPRCKTGTMRIISMKTGRQFIGCSNYPECTNTYSLPMGVKITGAGAACQNCGAPMIRGFSGGRKMFEICPNPADKTEQKPAAPVEPGMAPAAKQPVAAEKGAPKPAPRAPASAPSAKAQAPSVKMAPAPTEAAKPTKKSKMKPVKKAK